MTWIDSAYKTENCQNDTFLKNSKGNYDEEENTNPWRGSVTVTGASTDYVVKNIYDLAGNVFEWTMKSYNNVYRVFRGRCLQRIQVL